ncbi:MAG: transglutaminase-like domain-containing protein [Lachnospiraceae bacterium]|nr:transglutaminase-like domain-containing protein [Lachnospiraceae bacterium]
MKRAAALLLAVLLSVTTLSVYGYGFFSLPGLGALLCACIGTGICLFTDRYRLAGTVLMILYLTLNFALIGMLIRGGQAGSGEYFWQWVISRGEEMGVILPFVLAMILASSMFFSITVYYFSSVHYRIAMLTLVGLMPFVLYVKVMAEVSNRYLVPVAAGSILVHIAVMSEKRTVGDSLRQGDLRGFLRRKLRSGGEFRAAKILSFLMFSALVLLPAALVPKREDARFYREFENLFLNGNTTTAVADDFTHLADFSGDADVLGAGSNRRLYSVYMDGDTYWKRQNFDLFDPKLCRWTPGYATAFPEELDPDGFRRARADLSEASLLRALKDAEKERPGFLACYGAEKVLESPSLTENASRAMVHPENFSPAYYLSAPGCSAILIPEGEEGTVTVQDCILRNAQKGADDATYTVTYRNDEKTLELWIGTGLPLMDREQSERMLEEACEILQEARNPRAKVPAAFLSQLLEAERYEAWVFEQGDPVSDVVRSLAGERCAGAGSDAEKAVLLESYFRESGFSYDLDYRAPDDSPEYFLTQGRTGTCSDFASAFVLMARSEGLIVRYAEGFVTESSGRENLRYIMEQDSHAYAEVYLPNTGWVVFDPTAGVPGSDRTSLAQVWSMLRMDYGLLFTIILFVAGMNLIFFFLYFGLPFLGECAFRIRLLLMEPGEAARACLPRLKKKAKKGRKRGAFSGNVDAMTPRQFEAQLKSMGIPAGCVAACYEEALYAGRDPSKEQKEQLRKDYLLACSRIS